MQEIRRLIAKVAAIRLPVLLLGESGTGKEVVARAIHDANPTGQFVPIDCGSLVGTLMESELFGHVKGSFSGAVENKKGLVELADGGTAFFDEIGDLPLEMQVKLLRLVQEREFRAVGALQWRKVDLRIIAATHRDLKAEVAAGRFRQDLYYRLNVFTIHLPPLRDRKEDIPLLIDTSWTAGFDPGPESGGHPACPTTGRATCASCSIASSAWRRCTPKGRCVSPICPRLCSCTRLRAGLHRLSDRVACPEERTCLTSR